VSSEPIKPICYWQRKGGIYDADVWETTCGTRHIKAISVTEWKYCPLCRETIRLRSSVKDKLTDGLDGAYGA
jgi:hypothetical protein